MNSYCEHIKGMPGEWIERQLSVTSSRPGHIYSQEDRHRMKCLRDEKNDRINAGCWTLQKEKLK